MLFQNDSQKFHILIVEDNPSDVFLLRRALENAGVDYDLTVIEDGEQAVAYVRGHARDQAPEMPDLAVLDLNLPKDGGLDILQAMHRNPAFAKVPKVVLSSSSSPRQIEQIQESGVSQYIAKPGDLEQFLNIGQTLKDLLVESR